MTRFEAELNGKYGEFWKKEAEKALQNMTDDLANGLITIDADGVARNRIGRIMSGDQLEKLTYVTDEVDVEATKAAYDAYLTGFFNDYRSKRSKRSYSDEDLYEMRSTFGKGTKVVDIITGETISL